MNSKPAMLLSKTTTTIEYRVLSTSVKTQPSKIPEHRCSSCKDLVKGDLYGSSRP